MPKKKGVGQPESRHCRLPATNDKSGFKIGYDNSWAVVIGIDHYEDNNIRNLKHAVTDARGMAELLINSLGFLKDNVYVILDPAPQPSEITEFNLTNRKATKETIEKLLLTDIPERIKKDDRLLIFYAGHGERRSIAERKQGIGYLVPSNARSGEWHTYVEMSAIIQVLNWSAAKHIFYLLDCCYSGLATARANPKVSDFTEVCFANRALECLTAGTARQAVDDDGPEGHSTFTWTVIQGLKKEADWNGDDIITGTDLMVYVKNKLISTYGKLQTPDFGYFGGHESGGDFVFRLPELSSQDFFNLGVRLYDLGQRIDDPGRFESAARHFEQALQISRLANVPFPEAELWYGKSLIASGAYEKASKELMKLIDRNPTETPAETWFQLGIAQANQRDFIKAEKAFDEFLSRDPQNENAAWLKDFIELLRQEINGKKRALLIGINEYKSESIRLRGCVNDILIIKDVLQRKFGFDEADIITLTDGFATKRNVLIALNRLVKSSKNADTVIVHYSGWGLGIVGPNLLVHDSEYDQNKPNDAISAIDYKLLHQLLNQIPAKHTLFILDGNTTSEFVEITKKTALFQLILASSPGNLPLEVYSKFMGKFGYAGALSSTLSIVLSEVELSLLNYPELLDLVVKKLTEKKIDQTPVFIGDAKQLVLGQRDFYLFFWNIAQRRNYKPFETDDLKAWYDKFTKLVPSLFPLAHLSFGRAFLHKGDYVRGVKAVHTASEQRGDKDLDAIFSLGKAHLAAQQYSEAYKNFQLAATIAKTSQKSINLDNLLQITQRLLSCSKHALLIGINDYLNVEVPHIEGAVNDVEVFKEALTKRCGFQPENITVLLNANATTSAIMAEFRRLAEIACNEPALFYFAGNGAIGSDGKTMTILGADAGQHGGRIFPIKLQELADTAAYCNSSNLVTIIDAGWTESANPVKGMRIAPSGNVITPERFLDKDPYPSQLKIGMISIYPYSIKYGLQNSPQPLESIMPKAKGGNRAKTLGLLTYYLLKSLNKRGAVNFTYRQWLDATSEKLKPFRPIWFGRSLDESIFAPRVLQDALDCVEKIECIPLSEMIEMLKRIYERDEKNHENYLNLGLTYSAVGEWDKSINSLRHTVNLYNDPTIPEKEKQKDPDLAEEIQHQASYHLGRILYERKQDLGTAVDELRKAQKQDTDDVRICYYLGQAIRALVEQETLTEASDALQKYIDKGAPLDRRTEVMEFLKSRQSLK
jgi:uncharacterized caspase-like protein/Flp pilus assembly protein TadD